ncbi:hypothetical protein LCGC14_2440730 [marine sediment metagenome]|uniref:Uncharacterized protein n=1 Tax=marine sediment metagenome TaxID=412755 RepID=A0A0F9C6H9_9ZZZZ
MKHPMEHLMKWVSITAVLTVVVFVAALTLTGCAYDQGGGFDPLKTAEGLRAAGFSGEVCIMADSSGHIGGLAYDVLGTQVFLRVVITPVQEDDADGLDN